MLESAIAAGVTAAGGDALLAGVLPTPAAPLLVRRHGLHMAVVISASHNPYEDNGIKLFAADGFKLDDDTEHEIEAALGDPPATPERIGRVQPPARGAGGLSARAALPLLGARSERPPDPPGLRQRRHLPRRAGDLPPARRRGRGDRRRARRAQHQRRLRIDPPRAGDRADGRGRPRCAFAFDGDGDRVLAVDARRRGRRRRRADRAGGLHLTGAGPPAGRGRGRHRDDQLRLSHRDGGRRRGGGEYRRRRPLRARRAAPARLGPGGEQSGHIIELGFGPGGDGIASALLTLEALGGRDLRERDAMEKLPQRLVNIRAPTAPR